MVISHFNSFLVLLKEALSVESGWLFAETLPETPNEEWDDDEHPIGYLSDIADAVYSFNILAVHSGETIIDAICCLPELAPAFDILIAGCIQHFSGGDDVGEDNSPMAEALSHRDSSHYAYPFEERRAIVAKYWQLRSGGERVTKTEYARRHGIDRKTLNTYIGEFLELDPASPRDVVQ